MGFLDNIRSKFRGDDDDEYYDDEYYDDYQDDQVDTGTNNRGYNDSSRAEAESVSVYTRSGRPVQSADYSSSRSYSAMPSSDAYAYDSGAGVAGASTSTFGSSGNLTPGDVGSRTYSRENTGQLPPYVLKPVTYDDVMTVVRRVRTNQPVVLIFRNTNIETAKRILDFCYGLAYGINGKVQELGDRVFVVLPKGRELSDTDIKKLISDGDLEPSEEE